MIRSLLNPLLLFYVIIRYRTHIRMFNNYREDKGVSRSMLFYYQYP